MALSKINNNDFTKIIVKTTVRKIDIDWERVYSGFVTSGLSLREFHQLHLQCFFPGASLPALSPLARHMRGIRQPHECQAQQFIACWANS
jgi:hypothetical protein